MLVISAILMATTNVLLRHMKKMHEYTLTTYSVIASVAFFGMAVLLSEKKEVLLSTFDSSDYILLLVISISSIFGMICKIKAL